MAAPLPGTISTRTSCTISLTDGTARFVWDDINVDSITFKLTVCRDLVQLLSSKTLFSPKCPTTTANRL
jgi:hypothetical protein